jgi:hypothetical protein
MSYELITLAERARIKELQNALTRSQLAAFVLSCDTLDTACLFG